MCYIKIGLVKFMKKILFAILLSLSLVLISTNSAFAINIKKELNDKQEEIIKNFKPIDKDKIYYFFTTQGPARFVTEIEFIEGSILQILKMKYMLNRIILKPKAALAFPIKLTFKITYTTDVIENPRLSYGTGYLPFNLSLWAGKLTIISNVSHSYTIKNFTGIAYFAKAKIISFKPLRFFIPANFFFFGVCDEIVEHTT
jgi:hypothetical protein